MNKFIITVLSIFICSTSIYSQEIDFICGTELLSSDPHLKKQKFLYQNDGIYTTAQDTIRMLVVFVKFPNDNSNTPIYWPSNGFPSFATNSGANAFIDSDANQNSTHKYNITNYFRQMSLDKLIVLGDVVTVTAPKPASEYSTRADANRSILQKLDSTVNFSFYDNWKRISDFEHSNEPDSLVDMIYRGNVSSLLWDDGEASLGYTGGDLIVDEGNTTIGVGYPDGSGFTVKTRTNSINRLFYDMVHEYAHWLLGSGHPYSSGPLNRVWSMLQGSFVNAGSVNSYEREFLGWADVTELNSNTTDIVLNDFISTGDAYKFQPEGANSGEYIYLENHQKISVYDNTTNNLNDKGVFIIHQNGSYSNLHNIKMITSDGDWEWNFVGTKYGSCCGTQKVFEKDTPNPNTGQNYTKKFTQNGVTEWLYGYTNNGDTTVAANYQGLAFTGSFNQSKKPYFSKITNPKLMNWSRDGSSHAIKVKNQVADSIYVDFLTNYNPYTITEHTTWDGQIFLDEDTEVTNNAILTILPGTKVYLGDNVSLEIQPGAKLIAEGTEQQPIEFLKSDPVYGWDKISLLSSAGNSIKWALFDGGSVNLYVASKNNVIEHSTFRNASRGIQGWHNQDGSGNASTDISHCLIENNSIGIEAQFLGLDVSHTTVRNNYEEGMYVHSSMVHPFYQNLITGNGYDVHPEDGVGVTSSGTFYMLGPSYDEGYNEISNNADDQILTYGDTIVGAALGGGGGYNSVKGNYSGTKYLVDNNSGSSVNAVGTWWGQSSTDPAMFDGYVSGWNLSSDPTSSPGNDGESPAKAVSSP